MAQFFISLVCSHLRGRSRTLQLFNWSIVISINTKSAEYWITKKLVCKKTQLQQQNSTSTLTFVKSNLTYPDFPELCSLFRSQGGGGGRGLPTDIWATSSFGLDQLLSTSYQDDKCTTPQMNLAAHEWNFELLLFWNYLEREIGRPRFSLKFNQFPNSTFFWGGFSYFQIKFDKFELWLHNSCRELHFCRCSSFWTKL